MLVVSARSPFQPANIETQGCYVSTARLNDCQDTDCYLYSYVVLGNSTNKSCCCYRG